MSDQETLMVRSKLVEYLTKASKVFGVELKLNSDGICFFKHDISGLEFIIELPPQSDIVYFYSPICRIPYDHTEQFFEKLLENNLHGVANRQASFGLDAKTQNIVLTFSISMRHIDAVSLGNILANFVEVAERASHNTKKWIEENEKQHPLPDKDMGNLDVHATHNNLKMKV